MLFSCPALTASLRLPGLWAVVVFNIILAVFQFSFSIVLCCLCCANDTVWSQGTGGGAPPGKTSLSSPALLRQIKSEEPPLGAPCAGEEVSWTCLRGHFEPCLVPTAGRRPVLTRRMPPVPGVPMQPISSTQPMSPTDPAYSQAYGQNNPPPAYGQPTQAYIPEAQAVK